MDELLRRYGNQVNTGNFSNARMYLRGLEAELKRDCSQNEVWKNLIETYGKLHEAGIHEPYQASVSVLASFDLPGEMTPHLDSLVTLIGDGERILKPTLYKSFLKEIYTMASAHCISHGTTTLRDIFGIKNFSDFINTGSVDYNDLQKLFEEPFDFTPQDVYITDAIGAVYRSGKGKELSLPPNHPLLYDVAAEAMIFLAFMAHKIASYNCQQSTVNTLKSDLSSAMHQYFRLQGGEDMLTLRTQEGFCRGLTRALSNSTDAALVRDIREWTLDFFRFRYRQRTHTLNSDTEAPKWHDDRVETPGPYGHALNDLGDLIDIGP